MTELSIDEAYAIWTKLPAHQRKMLAQVLEVHQHGRDTPELAEWKDADRFAGPLVNPSAVLCASVLVGEWANAMQNEESEIAFSVLASLATYVTGLLFDVADGVEAESAT